MGSWRDTASQESQDDLDGLLNAVLPFAEQTLAKHGEMFPFGASVHGDGTIAMLAVDLGGEQSPSQVVLDALYRAAVQSVGSLRAVAFVADVRVTGGDAVRVELEHKDGIGLTLLALYSRSGGEGLVTFEEMTVGVGTRRIFSP